MLSSQTASTAWFVQCTTFVSDSFFEILYYASFHHKVIDIDWPMKGKSFQGMNTSSKLHTYLLINLYFHVYLWSEFTWCRLYHAHTMTRSCMGIFFTKTLHKLDVVHTRHLAQFFHVCVALVPLFRRHAPYFKTLFPISLLTLSTLRQNILGQI